MKRKFGFGLAPLKILSKPTPKTHQEHKNSLSEEWIQYTPPDSPLIDRRPPLDPRIELELRKACAVILQDFKPSDSGLDPPSNAKAFLQVDDAERFVAKRPVRQASAGWANDLGPQNVQRTNDVQEPSRDLDKIRSANKPEVALRDLFANDLFSNDIVHPSMDGTNKKRPTQPARVVAPEEHPIAPVSSNVRSSRDLISPSLKQQPTYERERTDTNGHNSATSTEASHYTVASTDWPRSASTTFTSPSVSSMRFSDQVYSELNAVAKSGDAATEKPKPRRNQHSEDFSWKPFDTKYSTSKQPDVAVPKEQPSVERSPEQLTGAGISGRDFVRPASPSIGRESRSGSVTSKTSHTSMEDAAPTRPSQGRWRSWGFRGLGNSNKAPPPSRGRNGSRTENILTDADMNLNRSLPPLPSLDSYKSEENNPKEVVSPTSPVSTHIATILRPDPRPSSISVTGPPKLVEVKSPESGSNSYFASKAQTATQATESRKYFVEPGTNVIRSRPDTASSKPPTRPDTSTSTRQPTSILKSPTASTFRDALSSHPTKTAGISSTATNETAEPAASSPIVPSFSRPTTARAKALAERRATPDAFDFDLLMSAMREGIRTPPSQSRRNSTSAASSPARDPPARPDLTLRSRSEDLLSHSSSTATQKPPHPKQAPQLQPLRVASAVSLHPASAASPTALTAQLAAGGASVADIARRPSPSPSSSAASALSRGAYQIAPGSPHLPAASSFLSDASHHDDDEDYTNEDAEATPYATSLHAPAPPSIATSRDVAGQDEPVVTSTLAPGARPLYSAGHSQYQARGLRKVLSALGSGNNGSSGGASGKKKVWVPPPTPNRGEWGWGRSVTSLDKWGVDERGVEVYASPGDEKDGSGEWGMYEVDEEACAAPVIRF